MVSRVSQLPGQLPADCVPESLDTSACASFVETALSRLTVDHVTTDAIWRDHLSLSGKVQTLHGADVVAGWQRAAATALPRNIRAMPGRVARYCPGHSWVDVSFTFQSAPLHGILTSGSGTAMLVPQGGAWKLWCFTTVMEFVEGHGNPDVWPASLSNAPKAPVDSAADKPHSVLIAGGGHSGLAMAGRLQALGIDNIVIDKHAAIGDSWTKQKYDSVKMHTAREMNHLPLGRTYDEQDPELLPSASVASAFQRYVRDHNLNVLSSTEVVKARFDKNQGVWHVELKSTESTPKLTTLRARHLVLAIGSSNNQSNVPTIAEQDLYKGRVLHTSEYKSSAEWKGRRAIVIGAATSGHDVADDMVQAGAEQVTMVQRGPVAVFPLPWIQAGTIMLYNRQVPTELADRIMALPWKIQREIAQLPMSRRMNQPYPLFDRLEDAGFKIDRTNGLYDLSLSRNGGYYIDCGTSDKIANGTIKIKSDAEIARFTSTGVEFADGTHIDADVVVFATGFRPSYPGQAVRLLGDEFADIPGFWGLDETGELLTAMKPIDPRLWLLAGGPHHVRFFSRFVALQIQIDLLSE